jgi:hypothetical protein
MDPKARTRRRWMVLMRGVQVRSALLEREVARFLLFVLVSPEAHTKDSSKRLILCTPSRLCFLLALGRVSSKVFRF